MLTHTFGWVAPETRGRAPHVGARTGTASGWAALRPAVQLGDLPEVWDQHTVGSCTAQAVAAAIWILLVRAGYAPELIDRAGIYRRAREMIGTPREDSGAILADLLAALAQGWTPERAEPPPAWGPAWEAPAPVPGPSAPRLVTWEALDYDDLSICTEIDAGHVVVVGLQIDNAWEDFSGDTLPLPAGPVIGGHALAIVGYDVARRMYLIRNSWSRAWKLGGYAWIPFEWVRAPWCGEAHVLRAVRRAEPLPPKVDDLGEDRTDTLRPPKELEPALRDPLDGFEAGVFEVLREPSRAVASRREPSPDRPARHALDAIGARRVWHYPLPADPLRLVEDLRAHGVTGLVPQQSALAVAWSRRWAPALAREGLDLVVGLGKISSKHILDALDAPAAGCMVNQEDWKSVRDSRAVCDEVLRVRPDAAARTVDCHYPCLTVDPETERRTGWGKIAAAWAPLCGLRAPQCYWARGGGGTVDGPRDGWVAARLAWSRRDYPRAGGSPATRVRLARQLYRASVQDHVVLLLAESTTGSVWLWNWPEADASARLALRVVYALERRGHRGGAAVRDFQLAAGLVVDGVVGPATCGALGLEVPAGITWTRRRAVAMRELALVVDRAPARGEASVELVEDGWVLRGPDVPGGLHVDPVLIPAAPGTWRVEGTGIALRDVPSKAPWELPLDPGA